MKEKTIKVLIEIPSKWVDFESPLGLAAFTIRERLDLLLKEKVIDKAVSQMEIPKIQITPEEVKNRMLDILAKRALENREEACRETE